MANAAAAIEAGLIVAAAAGVLAVAAEVVGRAGADVALLIVGARATVEARVLLAEVPSGLAMPAHVAGLADALEVVHQLDALLGAVIVARIGKALVDVALTTRPHVPGGTDALVAPDLVDAPAAVVASSYEAVVDILFTMGSLGSMWARAPVGVDQVNAGAVVARVVLAVVDVELTVPALVTSRAVALVGADQVLAGGPAVAGVRRALVVLKLAVAAVVALGAGTEVGISGIPNGKKISYGMWKLKVRFLLRSPTQIPP